MIQHAQYRTVQSRFWLFILMWCVCFFCLTGVTKYMIAMGVLAANVWGIFVLGMCWFALGVLCVVLDNYRRTICIVCNKQKKIKDVPKMLDRILDFRGCASRGEFFWGLLLYGILIFGLVTLILLFLHNGMLALIACLLFLVPVWALFVRRLRDAGASGWWTLVPVVGVVVFCVSWFVGMFWYTSCFLADIGTDLWGLLIYLVSVFFIGLIPSKTVKTRKRNR